MIFLYSAAISSSIKDYSPGLKPIYAARRTIFEPFNTPIQKNRRPGQERTGPRGKSHAALRNPSHPPTPRTTITGEYSPWEHHCARRKPRSVRRFAPRRPSQRPSRDGVRPDATQRPSRLDPIVPIPERGAQNRPLPDPPPENRPAPRHRSPSRPGRDLSRTLYPGLAFSTMRDPTQSRLTIG